MQKSRTVGYSSRGTEGSAMPFLYPAGAQLDQMVGRECSENSFQGFQKDL